MMQTIKKWSYFPKLAVIFRYGDICMQYNTANARIRQNTAALVTLARKVMIKGRV